MSVSLSLSPSFTDSVSHENLNHSDDMENPMANEQNVIQNGHHHENENDAENFPSEDSDPSPSPSPSPPLPLSSSFRENIHVAVRVRPLLSKEISSSDVICWDIDEETQTLHQIIRSEKHQKFKGKNIPTANANKGKGNQSVTQMVTMNNSQSLENSFSASSQSQSQSLSSVLPLAPLPSFHCGKLYSMSSSTYDVYVGSVLPLVDSTLCGINSTIFCYGQTSGGKTFSMKGTGDLSQTANENSPMDKESFGIIQLGISQIFSHISDNLDREFLVRCSYIEIYNENIRDLLTQSEDSPLSHGLSPSLPIHESKERGVYVNTNEVIVCSVRDVMSLLGVGESRRHYGRTQMNDLSSRSHTIFRIVLESRRKRSAEEMEISKKEKELKLKEQRQRGNKKKNPKSQSQKSESFPSKSKEKEKVRVSVLNFVDLAGSERLSQTLAVGQQQKEGMLINKSLLFLGVVIAKLAEEKENHHGNGNGNGSFPSPSDSHIPYRDSKLTRILQNSLGGNSRTAILCHVAPSLSNVEHTISTLRFGQKALQIRNVAKVNEIVKEKTMLHQKEVEIEEFNRRIEEIPTGKGEGEEEKIVSSPSPFLSFAKSDEEEMRLNELLHSERALLAEERNKTLEQKHQLDERVAELKRMILTSDHDNDSHSFPSVDSKRRATFGTGRERPETFFNFYSKVQRNQMAMGNHKSLISLTMSDAEDKDKDSTLSVRFSHQSYKISKLETLLNELSIENTQLMSQVNDLTSEVETQTQQMESMNLMVEEREAQWRETEKIQEMLSLGDDNDGEFSGGQWNFHSLAKWKISDLISMENKMQNSLKKINKYLIVREIAQAERTAKRKQNGEVETQREGEEEEEQKDKLDSVSSLLHSIDLITTTLSLNRQNTELRSHISQNVSTVSTLDSTIHSLRQETLTLKNQLREMENISLEKDRIHQQNSALSVLSSEEILGKEKNMAEKLQKSEKEISELREQNAKFSLQILQFMDPKGFGEKEKEKEKEREHKEKEISMMDMGKSKGNGNEIQRHSAIDLVNGNVEKDQSISAESDSPSSSSSSSSSPLSLDDLLLNKENSFSTLENTLGSHSALPYNSNLQYQYSYKYPSMAMPFPLTTTTTTPQILNANSIHQNPNPNPSNRPIAPSNLQTHCAPPLTGQNSSSSSSSSKSTVLPPHANVNANPHIIPLNRKTSANKGSTTASSASATATTGRGRK